MNTMKTLLTLLSFLLMTMGISAQNATIKVTDVHGLVTYQASKLAAPQRVWPGANCRSVAGSMCRKGRPSICSMAAHYTG